MRTPFTFFASVVLNSVLALVVGWLVHTSSYPVEKRGAPASKRVAEAQSSDLRKYPVNKSEAFQRRWLVDQLRVLGMPEGMLARFVQSDLDKRWTHYSGKYALECFGDPVKMATLQWEIDSRRDADMRAALGENGFRRWDEGQMLRESNLGRVQLTSLERDAAYALWKKAQRLELKLRRANLNAEIDDADAVEAHNEALANFNQQVATLLGPERYAASQQTDTATAKESLRREFASAQPSDAQYGDLLKTQQRWAELRAEIEREFGGQSSSADYTELIKNLDDARDREYRRVLGDTVFETVAKEANPIYSTMKKHAALWNLNPAEIEHVYGVVKFYDKNTNEHLSQIAARESRGEEVNWNEATSDIHQLAEQTRRSLEGYLGRERFNKMQENGVFSFSSALRQ